VFVTRLIEDCGGKWARNFAAALDGGAAAYGHLSNARATAVVAGSCWDSSIREPGKMPRRARHATVSPTGLAQYHVGAQRQRKGPRSVGNIASGGNGAFRLATCSGWWDPPVGRREKEIASLSGLMVSRFVLGLSSVDANWRKNHLPLFLPGPVS